MNNEKTLTFAFMDPPFENERTVTFFRLLDAALERGVNQTIAGCGRGGPPDLWRYASESFNTLVIGTR